MVAMSIRPVLWIVLIVLSFEAGAADLTVSAAASLTAVLNEAKPVFESTHPGIRLYYNFAASGTLARQIDAGAPADIFISASSQSMDQLQAHHRILDGTRINLLSNEMVLIVPKGEGARLKGFEDLPKAVRIAVGNPGFVPAGQYANQILVHLGLLESLRPKLVYGQDVRQVLEYVVRKEVDAGIVFATDAALLRDKVEPVARAPAGSHQPILYPVAILVGARNPEQARIFLDFLSSVPGRELFEKHGFDWALK